MAADIPKLQSLIAHIARSRPGLGKVRLFKLLYLIDFKAHAELGESVTGELYENFEMGPVPKTLWKHFGEITRTCVTVESVDMGIGLPEQQMIARADFTSTLSPQEVHVADGILARYGSFSGTSLKELTHKQIPYLATRRGESIPYGLSGYLFFTRPSVDDAAAIRNNKALMERVRAAVVAKHRRTA